MRCFVFECLRLSGFFKVAWLEKRIQLSVLRVTDHQLSKKRKITDKSSFFTYNYY